MNVHQDMYIKLFQQVSKTIEELQKVQQECEEIFMENPSKPPIVLKPAEGAGRDRDICPLL